MAQHKLKGPGVNSYGQSISYSGGTLTVSGCTSADEALWRVCGFARMTKKEMRKALTGDQKSRLIEIARRKLCSQ